MLNDIHKFVHTRDDKVKNTFKITQHQINYKKLRLLKLHQIGQKWIKKNQ